MVLDFPTSEKDNSKYTKEKKNKGVMENKRNLSAEPKGCHKELSLRVMKFWLCPKFP